MAKSILKQEWDDKKGNIKRKCKVCDKEFIPKKWNLIICEDSFCKRGSLLFAHYKASLKRWEKWKEEAKIKNLDYKLKI